MQVNLYDRFSDIPLTPDQWNGLHRGSAVGTVFQTYEWANAWWQAFGDRYRLLCIAVTDEDRVLGMAPLMSAANAKDWHFLADVNSDYCDFATITNRYSVLDRLLSFFVRDYRDWNRLSLRNIPEQSTTLATLATLCEKYGLGLQIGKRIVAPEIRFSDEPQDYRVKYSVRRHCNRLERLGKVEFRVLQDARELPKTLDLLYRQHRSRYRQKGVRSLFEDPLCRRFYELLAYEFLDKGWLHFSQLLLNGIPLAVHYGFEYDRVLTWYKPAFDLDYRQYSPGTVLIKNLIGYAQQRRLRALDFTIGDEEFKSRFSYAVSYNRNVILYRDRRWTRLRGWTDRAANLGRKARSAVE